jgi:predicted amidophosphoribosyltransferase
MPVHLCPVPGPLYTVLMGYKESPVDEARRRFTRRVHELFAAFLAEHSTCLHAAIGGTAELVLPVPSSSRPGPASLERVGGWDELVVSALGAAAGWDPSVLRRAHGQIGHMEPNRRAFVVRRAARATVGGARVLLLDDTYVSGSRAQSAAAALRLAGAGPTLIVPLGRVLRPERSRAHAAFLEARRSMESHHPRCLLVQTGTGKG